MIEAKWFATERAIRSSRSTIEGKLNTLCDKGNVSKNQAKVLHELRKLGNDAVHQMDEPPLDLVGECIDAI
ncbi:MAG: hypothetical protein C0483_04800 [Pirellula sp.]|nr:hypothetical protein [Pirellula sp.]